MKWRWKGKELEEVRSFKYLGYTIMGSGGAGRACGGESDEGSGGDGEGVGVGEKIVWEGLGQKDMVVRQVGMGGGGIWGGGVGLEGEGESGGVAGKIPEVGAGGE